jgi:hypothetical protein
MKFAPVPYNWRVKLRTFSWYDRLRRVEHSLGRGLTTPQIIALQTELARMEQAVSQIQAPLRFSDQLYDLRNAINIVRQRLALQHSAALH